MLEFEMGRGDRRKERKLARGSRGELFRRWMIGMVRKVG